MKECLLLEKDPASPDLIQAKNLLARVLLKRREVEQARRLADEVIKNSPKNVEGHFIKGNIDLVQGEGSAAVSEFRTVVNEKPQAADGYLLLAEAHLLKGETALALDTLQRAQKIAPSSRDVPRALARFHAA